MIIIIIIISHLQLQYQQHHHHLLLKDLKIIILNQSSRIHLDHSVTLNIRHKGFLIHFIHSTVPICFKYPLPLQRWVHISKVQSRFYFI